MIKHAEFAEGGKEGKEQRLELEGKEKESKVTKNKGK